MAQQIKKKFIKSDAIDGSKILLEANQTLRKKDGLGGEIDVLQNLKDYTDQKVADLVNSAPEVLDTLKELSDALGGDANFATTIANQIGAVDSKIDQEILDRQAADTELTQQVNSKLSLSGGTMTGILDMDSISIINLADPVNPGDAAHKDYVDTSVASEALARQDADSSLQSQIDTEKNRIDAILLASQADKDSFAEIVSLINSVDTENDEAFAGYVASNNAAVSELDSRLDVVEPKVSTLETNVSSLQVDLSSLDVYAQEIRFDVDNQETRIQALEAQTDGPSFHKMKIVIDESSELSYVDLNHEAIANSLVVAVGRLMAHMDEDFTVSVESGKTRLTWIGAFAAGGEEAIDLTDVIFVTYAVDV